MNTFHEPVLKDAVLQQFINIEEGWIVDGTLGDGGHTEYLLDHTGPGVGLLGIDRDASALARARLRLERFGKRARFAHGNFSQLLHVLKEAGIDRIEGLRRDLGVSSMQLDTAGRGFSFRHDGPLDMRMDRDEATTAADLLNTLSDRELETILREYGEERNAKRIMRAIRKAQSKSPIQTTSQLVQVLSHAVGSPRPTRIHPATRTFQALRIAVNNELQHLTIALRDSLGVLSAAARVVVISFHSLEDRIVKTFFREEQRGCVCPPKLPVCVCGRKATLRVLTSKPIIPSMEEIRQNPRASSAKLRAAERVYA